MAKKKKKIEYSVSFLCPACLFGHRSDSINEESYYGFSVSNISFGISLCTYDYGRIFEVTFFGFGISVWWF